MIIFLDFDGTCVEHEYPKIGRENFGCIPVIDKLMNAGHIFILNTFRANVSMEEAKRAFDWLRVRLDRNVASVRTEKLTPGEWNWQNILDNDLMFIDDQALNMPLKPAVMTNGKMVDWDYLDKEFEQRGLYKLINTEQ